MVLILLIKAFLENIISLIRATLAISADVVSTGVLVAATGEMFEVVLISEMWMRM